MLLNNIKNLILTTHQNNLAQTQSLVPVPTSMQQPSNASNASIIRNSIGNVSNIGGGTTGVGLASIVTDNNVGVN
jgi:hypothetical protein